MAFTFIHTADWQIGKPFGSFPERLAGRLEDARLDAIDAVAGVARQHGASHVLVAGDVYDAPDLSEKALRQPLSRMAAHEQVRFVLLPGNHDLAVPGGVWDRVRRIGLPDNVVLADRPAPVWLATSVSLLPAPLVSRATREDPTAWMAAAEIDGASMRIGLAHGAVRGFGSLMESAVPIGPDRALSAGLDYLALGDWHGTKQVNARTWYSGTPEPDSFTDNPRGQVLVVRIAGRGAPAEVSPVATGKYVWARLEERLSGLQDLAAIDRRIEGFGAGAGRLILSLAVSGALPLDGLAALTDWRVALEGRIQHLDYDDSALMLADSDRAGLDAGWAGDTGIEAVAAGLAITAGDIAVAEPERHIARHALMRLLALVREAQVEGA